MKKFFITLLILIILGGTGFFFGWTQFAVPPGAYGVMSSKTHGIDPQLIKPGEFRWVWYRLIPTNTTISVFRIEPVHRDISIHSTLPSGNVYSIFAGNQVNFDWNFYGSFAFTLKSENLVSLSSDRKINSQGELNEYQQILADEIESFIILCLNSPGDANELEELLAGSSETLERQVLGRFPILESFSCIIKNANFPDFILYRQVRGLYEEFVSAQREITASTLIKRAESRIDSMFRLGELERYGELLSKYPILLEYLTKVQKAE